MFNLTLFKILRMSLCVGLLVAVVSCDRSEAPPVVEAPALPVQKQQGELLVTLEPPYAQWYWEQNPPEPRLSVRNAVWAVAKQVGMDYNREKSFENTKPACDTWIQPNFKDKPWRESLDKMLAPVKLSYMIEDERIVLVTAEYRSMREQAAQHFRTALASLQSAGRELPRLHDAVIVLPLLDSRHKTTEMGTVLSLLAMSKATYIPDKVLNLHLPTMIELYSDLGYFEAGNELLRRDLERLKARCEAKDWATGTLEVKPNETFRVALNFDGEHGQTEFETSGPMSNLNTIPEWMARRVHQQCGVTLGAKQEAYVMRPEFGNVSDLQKFVETETEYHDRRWWFPNHWREALALCPDSAFGLYRYYQATGYVRKRSGTKSFTLTTQRLENHGLVQFLEADWYLKNKEYHVAVQRFVELLKTDIRNDAIYEKLSDAFLKLGLHDLNGPLHEFWRTWEPDSYLPYLVEGESCIKSAWNARGTGWPWEVPAPQQELFRKHLEIAEQLLTRACELNPTDPRPPTQLIKGALGWQPPGGRRIEERFQKAISADPKYYAAYIHKLQCLLPIWYGSREEMFAFARECAANPPPGSRVAFILVTAHNKTAETKSGDQDPTSYYRDPEVWNDIRAVYERYLAEHPNSLWDRNFFAKYAFLAGDYEEAAKQFNLIGDNMHTRCWQSREHFTECRSETFAAIRTKRR